MNKHSALLILKGSSKDVSLLTPTQFPIAFKFCLIYMGVLHACVSVQHIHVVPEEARRWRVGALGVLPEDLGLISSTHVVANKGL